MGNKQWRKQLRYQHRIFFKGSRASMSREVQTEPVYICDAGPSLLHGWNDNAYVTSDTHSKSNISNDFEAGACRDNVHERLDKLPPSSAVDKNWEWHLLQSDLPIDDNEEEDGRKGLAEGKPTDFDVENSQSYWGDTSSAELDEFLVAETLCNEREVSDCEFVIDNDFSADCMPDLQNCPSEKKQEKSVASDTVKSSVLDKGDKIQAHTHNRHLHASSVGRPGMGGEKNLEYTFYVDDVDQVKKPFYDRRICALINIDGCHVNLLDREATDKRKIYYKGTPVRPVVISAPSMSALRRCLGRIDTQFPRFNAKAFLRE